MKLLALITPCYPVFGGAQVSTFTILRRLQREFGWEVGVAARHHERIRRVYGGVPFETYRDADELRALALRERPDVSMSALDSVPDGLRLARRFGVPTIVSLVSFEYCPPTDEEIRAWGVSAVRLYPDESERRWAFDDASLLVSNSHFLRDRVRTHTGAESDVLYPEFEDSEFRPVRRRSPKAIVGVCGHRYKGADVFLALADAFPREAFHLAGDVDPELADAFAARPNVRRLGRTSMRRLLSDAKVALVPSQWPEPFGRVAVEAMACGVPTLASRTGGLAEIVADAPFGVTAFREPDAWVAALSALLVSRDRRDELASTAEATVAKFLRGDSTRELARSAEACARAAKPDYDTRVVAVCGGTQQKTAFSMVNGHWVSALSKVQGVRVADVERAQELSRDLPDVTIWHDLSADFSKVTFPDAGHLVVCRTWDFGPYPPDWARRIRDEADLLAVHCRFVRRHAIESGVPAARVVAAPLGFDETVFVPEGPTYPLRTKKGFRFVFTGAAVVRKGIDVLLEAYRRAFGPRDDVCLVIKDHARDLFYEGETFRDRIEQAVDDSRGPEVEYISAFLSPEDLAALYRSCDVGVFPYRAEGFGLPILETMASGVPSIVPRFGAALDVCAEATSFLLPVRRMPLPVHESFAVNTLGVRAKIDEVEFCETPIDALAARMRSVAALPREQIAAKARRGVAVAQHGFRWEHVSKKLLDRALRTLGGTPRRTRRARTARRVEQRRLEVARELFLGARSPAPESRRS